MQRSFSQPGATTTLLTIALSFLLCTVSVDGEVFKSTVHFDAHSIGIESMSTAADTQMVVRRWWFRAGGRLTGRARVYAPTNAAAGTWYAGTPVVMVKIIPQTAWDYLLPLDVPDSDVAPTVRLDNLLRAQYRADCATSAFDTVLLNTSSTQAVESEWTWAMEDDVQVTVVVQQCTNRTLAVDVELTLLNPGGVQSSAEIIPLLNLYVVSAVLQLLVLILYSGALYLNRGGRVPPRVLLMFIAVMTFKTFSAVVSAMRYLRLRTSEDQARTGLDGTADFFNFVADILLILCLQLLCSGYSTVRMTLSRREKQATAVCVLGYTATRMANFVCNAAGGLAETCEGITLSDNLCRFVCMVMACIYLMRLIDVLTRRLSAPYAMSLVAMRKGEPTQAPESLTRFANIPMLFTLQSFRWPLFLYTLIPAFSLVVETTVLSTQTELVKTIIEEYSAILIYAVVGFHFTALIPMEQPKRRNPERGIRRRPIAPD
jgi:hypothetical protein